jgi:hypothetical protein
MLQYAWQPYACALAPTRSLPLRQCLAGKTLQLMGDSHMRYLFKFFAGLNYNDPSCHLGVQHCIGKLEGAPETTVIYRKIDDGQLLVAFVLWSGLLLTGLPVQATRCGTRSSRRTWPCTMSATTCTASYVGLVLCLSSFQASHCCCH